MANSSIDFVNDGYYPSEPVKQEQGDYAKTVFLWYVRLPQPLHPSEFFPSYIQWELGIRDAEKYQRRMIAEKMLVPATYREGLSFLKGTELKKICKELGLKQSGLKDEVILRIQESATEKQLAPFFKEPIYKLSEAAEQFLEENSDLIYLHRNNDLMITYEDYQTHCKKGESLESFIKRVKFAEMSDRENVHPDWTARTLGVFLLDHGQHADGLDLLILSVFLSINDRRWINSFAFHTLQDVEDHFNQCRMIGEKTLDRMREASAYYSKLSTGIPYEKFFTITPPLLHPDSFEKLIEEILFNDMDADTVNTIIKEIYLGALEQS